MEEYALFINGEFVEIKKKSSRPPHIPHKNVEWYPVLRMQIDNTTQTEYIERIVTKELIGDEYVITATKQDVPPAEMAARIEEDKTINVNRIERNYSIEKALGSVLFEVVNQVRVLNGQAEITLEQFKTYLRNKL